jgi:PAS domain S-box-containing protein
MKKLSHAPQPSRRHVLPQGESHLAAIVQSVKLAVISVDQAQNIVLFNAEAEVIFRCSAAEALGAPLDRFIPESARAAHRQHMANYDGSFAQHGARSMGGDRILNGLRADGETFPMDATILRTRIDGHSLDTVILRDVTDRVRVQNQLQRYATMIESSGDAIVSRQMDGTIVTWNPAAQKLFGYTRNEIVGQDIATLYAPQTPAGERDLARRAAGGESIVNFETVRRHKDGTSVEVAITISPVRNVDGELVGSVGVFRDIGERKRMEAQLRRLLQEQRTAEAEVRESRDRLRELSSALQTIREEEKTRIARELHDELGQALTALKMDASALGNELDLAQAALRKRTEGMKQLIDSTVNSVRRISADLRPVMLDNLGLVPTLEWLAKDFSTRTGIRVELDIPDENLGLDGDAATAIFRITQEALTNVSRHAGATQVDIEVKRRGGNVVARIGDNGKGLALGDTKKARSFGLLGMRERAYVLGGALNISTSPQGGTLIEAVIPMFGTSKAGAA